MSTWLLLLLAPTHTVPLPTGTMVAAVVAGVLWGHLHPHLARCPWIYSTTPTHYMHSSHSSLLPSPAPVHPWLCIVYVCGWCGGYSHIALLTCSSLRPPPRAPCAPSPSSHTATMAMLICCLLLCTLLHAPPCGSRVPLPVGGYLLPAMLHGILLCSSVHSGV